MQIAIENAEDDGAQNHSHARGEERPATISDLSARGPRPEMRRQKCADVDPHVEDVVGRIAQRAARGIKLPTIVEMLGLKNPLPMKMSTSAA